jgi:FkbM family methyltransferase
MVGANIGSYTILASAVSGSQTISMSLSLPLFLISSHVQINNVEGLVQLVNAGVGSSASKLRFTKDEDTVNHVVLNDDLSQNTVEVDVFRLDEICKNKTPLLIKMDVEGFEFEALKGAKNILSDDQLQAMIIELNGSCNRYGVTEQQIHDYILSFGFHPYQYEPFGRKLSRLDGYSSSGNTIYIRSEKAVAGKINASPKYKVLNSTI